MGITTLINMEVVMEKPFVFIVCPGVIDHQLIQNLDSNDKNNHFKIHYSSTCDIIQKGFNIDPFEDDNLMPVLVTDEEVDSKILDFIPVINVRSPMNWMLDEGYDCFEIDIINDNLTVDEVECIEDVIRRDDHSLLIYNRYTTNVYPMIMSTNEHVIGKVLDDIYESNRRDLSAYIGATTYRINEYIEYDKEAIPIDYNSIIIKQLEWELCYDVRGGGMTQLPPSTNETNPLKLPFIGLYQYRHI